ncbi:MAG: hypothetical protein ACRDIW_10690 [Actinomycetota bacterium]
MSGEHAVTNHLLHVLFVGGAAVAFVAFVVIDVRHHGWPSFSWRTGETEPRP